VLQVVLQWMQKGCHPSVRIIFSFIVFDKSQINLVTLVDMLKQIICWEAERVHHWCGVQV
jgi:hypothetical protein